MSLHEDNSQYWLDMWNSNPTLSFISFSKLNLKSALDYFYDLNIPTNTHILVPLCGKNKDMLSLETAGYNVIGIEVSKIAVEKFFNENNLEFKTNQLNEYSVYKSLNKNITLYCGNIFNIFDIDLCYGFYDCRGFPAISIDTREKYISKIQSFLLPVSKGILTTVTYPDTHKKDTPPFSISDTDVKKLFKSFEVKCVEKSCPTLSGDEKDKILENTFFSIYSLTYLNT